MKRSRRFLTFSLVTVGIMGLLLLLIIPRMPKPPLNDFDSARRAINDARMSRADIYSPEYFRKSEIFFDSAMVYWHMENNRFFLLRDYSIAHDFAVQSFRNAKRARENARRVSESLPAILEGKMDSLTSELEAHRELVSVLPVSDQAMKDLGRGRLDLAEAESAFDQRDYILCSMKLEAAEAGLRGSFQTAFEMLDAYFKNYRNWQKWAESTIQSSARNNSYVIIIDKIGREARVYHRGIQVQSFRIELGRNWIGDKQFQGDKATPEGYYTVIEKKKHPHTKYYKALLLDYPNRDDIRRFSQGRKEGLLPGSAEIGGHIEIHGEGGRGNDWTDGCIAMKNKDMDMLYGMAGAGTRVTIVGSLKPLEEVWETSY